MCGILALLAGACSNDTSKDGGNTSGKVGTIKGSLTEADMGASATGVSAFSVGDDGQLELVGSGSIAANGTFQIDDVDAGQGPFIVQVDGQTQGQVLGEVIVPEDIASGDTVQAQPISGETTIEGQALVTILAGDADRSDVDTIGLMTWITAELAAHVDAQSGAGSLGAAFMSAQDGYLQLTGTTAARLEDAELGAWGQLTASLATSTSDAATVDAWGDFMAQVNADVATKLSIDASQQADAQAAAAVLFQAALSSNAAIENGAARIGAVLTAHADWAAQADAAAGSSAEAAVDAQLDAAYSAFFSAMSTASDNEAMGQAWLDLSAAVSGHGEASGDSALSLLIDGEGQGSLEASVQAAIDATASAHATLDAQIQAALSGSASQRVSAVVAAYTAFEGNLAAALDAHFDSNLSARVEAFASQASSQLSGHVSVLLDLDLFGDIGGDLGIDIVGQIVAGIDGGAEGLFGSATIDPMIGAVTAVLVSLDASGSVHTVATGTIDQATHGYSFEGVVDATGSLFVELQDAHGEVTGAVQLDAITATSGQVTGASISQETTVETQVLIQRVADGEAMGSIDMASIEASIDGAIAAAADDDLAIQALATATVAAEASASAAGEGSAQAQTEAAMTFAVVVGQLQGTNVDLGLAAEAHAHLDAALALQSDVMATFAGSSFAGETSAVQAAVSAYVSATAAATSSAQLDAATSAFASAMLSVRDDMASSDLSLDLVGQAAINTALTASSTAAATFEAAIGVAFTGNNGSGGLSVSGFASAFATAQATLDAALDASLALTTVTMSSADHDAVASFVTQLALGFHGSMAAN